MWGRQRITGRRLLVLVRHLPADGAVARAQGAWPDSTELQAQVLEHLDALARLLWSGFSGGKRPPWKDLRVPRPGEPARPAQPARREATPEELATILELPLPGRG